MSRYRWPQNLGQRRKEIKANRKKMRKRVVMGDRGQDFIILVVWESGNSIDPKFRLANTKNMRSKLKSPISVMCLSR